MDLDKFLDKEIQSMEKELSEKRGVPEHPKAAAEKRKKTFISRYGKEAWEKKEKIAKGLKDEPGIEEPHAVATAWALRPKKTAKKAAASRKK